MSHWAASFFSTRISQESAQPNILLKTSNKFPFLAVPAFLAGFPEVGRLAGSLRQGGLQTFVTPIGHAAQCSRWMWILA